MFYWTWQAWAIWLLASIIGPLGIGLMGLLIKWPILLSFFLGFIGPIVALVIVDRIADKHNWTRSY